MLQDIQTVTGLWNSLFIGKYEISCKPVSEPNFSKSLLLLHINNITDMKMFNRPAPLTTCQELCK